MDTFNPSNPHLIVELVPGALEGQPPYVQLHMVRIPGAWPTASNMLLQALQSAMLEGFTMLARKEPEILLTHQMPPERH